MNRLPLFVVIIIALTACEEQADNHVFLPPGIYEGIYYRWSWADPDPRVAHVSISFNDGSFSGGSSISRYPAICNGKYSLSGSDVTFTNHCVWTADFDWSFILAGTFQIRQEGEYIHLVRKSEHGIDFYKLKRNIINQ